MNENGNKYALAALKDKRATLAGEIADLKKRLAWRQSQLDHVDATLTIFEPGFDVDAIGVKRPKKRVKLFAQGQLGRTIMDVLRRAEKPTGTHDVVTGLLMALGHEESARNALTPRARSNLAYLQKAKKVTKAGRGMKVVWALENKE
jgi:hypothetical protein